MQLVYHIYRGKSISVPPALQKAAALPERQCCFTENESGRDISIAEQAYLDVTVQECRACADDLQGCWDGRNRDRDVK